jgi:hypothetical protein
MEDCERKRLFILKDAMWRAGSARRRVHVLDMISLALCLSKWRYATVPGASSMMSWLCPFLMKLCTT